MFGLALDFPGDTAFPSGYQDKPAPVKMQVWAAARASHVEPIPDGRWIAGMGPVAGPALGPFLKRLHALAPEVAWLGANVLWPKAGGRGIPPV
jgi:hypothetical protein